MGSRYLGWIACVPVMGHVLAQSTNLVSVGLSGVPGNEDSHFVSISGDGRYLAFSSHAWNLVTGDTNGDSDIFVHDRQTRTTIRASLTALGQQANNNSYVPVISPDGRFVAFSSFASNLVANDVNSAPDAFVRDLQAGTTTLVGLDSAGAQPNAFSTATSVSDGGRYAGFLTTASNVVPGDTNGALDGFVRDL